MIGALAHDQTHETNEINNLARSFPPPTRTGHNTTLILIQPQCVPGRCNTLQRPPLWNPKQHNLSFFFCHYSPEFGITSNRKAYVPRSYLTNVSVSLSGLEFTECGPNNARHLIMKQVKFMRCGKDDVDQTIMCRQLL